MIASLNNPGQDEKRTRLIAAISTAALTIAVVVVMMCTHLSITKLEISQADKGQIEMDEFIEIMPMPAAPKMSGSEPSRAKAEEQLPSQPTPESGTDLEDNGPAGEAAPVVTQEAESPVKVAKKEEKPAAPAVDKKKEEEKAIQRQANNEIANAFSRSSGKHNNASGATDVGNNGVPSGNATSGTLTGRGTGTAGGGWSIPGYAAVQSTVTGSVKMVVTIDRNGNVTDLRFDGGDAPAATNSQVRQACAAEVRSRKFTRANYDNAPETSTAYITYTFK